MKLIYFIYFFNIAHTTRHSQSINNFGLNCFCFLHSSTFYNNKKNIERRFSAFSKGGKELEDYESGLTEEDLNTINEYLADIKSGVYGLESKKELEKLEKDYEKNHHETNFDLKDVLNTKNEKLEKEMNKIFDLSNLPSSENSKINWEDLENQISEGKKKCLDVEEMKKTVHSIYREKGLLSETFKVLEISGLKLKWRQSLGNIEIYFTADQSTKKKDYEIKFLPSTLTIINLEKVLLEKTLFGKVDCDGCFWTMYKDPSTGTKYVNINLRKRPPKFNTMWDSIFV
ncbi:CS domain protein [Theileria parva strain Muguga]|uniref:CS domain protein n=1 Tax=Theileria parva strain Muguga TaxID=333668 RepID=UPI001C617CF7|nr:CS domain protein [Theileria parva strain Muguga]KAF5153331.1 CS domain protein [Theileria parva strain Muguga]